VVFRGSESKTDWYYNLHLLKHKLNDKIKVHDGFYKQLTDNDVYTKLVNQIKTLLIKYPEFSIYITGHSSGGALSTLFGYMLSNEIEEDITIISFASPRVGNYEWKKAFETKPNLMHYRITNHRDIVTAFPYYMYHHVGHNIRLYNNKYNFIKCDTKRKWYEETIFTCWSMDEHNSDLYYNRLTGTEW
jgi:predicted lipase